MSAKSLLMAGALALASVPLAFGMSYEVVFPTPVQASNVQLAPGAYRVRAKNGEAIFRNIGTGTTYAVPATVEHLASKNHSENVVMGYMNGEPQIQSIQVGGHHIDLQFGE